MLDKWKAENPAENRLILSCVAEATLYCGGQCIALWGNKEQQDSLENHGKLFVIDETDSQL